MKRKWIIGVAALGAISMANAQQQDSSGSSVRIYGVADLAVAHYRTSGQSKTAMHAGGSGSRLGFLSSEDLGQGLKANARLEAGINLDSGTSSSTNGMPNRFWSRQAYVELESRAWGAIRAGRLEGPTYNFFPKFDPMLLPAMDAWGVLTTLGSGAPGSASGRGVSTGFLINPTQRTENTLAYISPRWSGLQAKLSYSFNEGSQTQPKLIEAAVDYDNGPLTLGALLVRASSTPGSGSVRPTKSNTEYALGASYKAGPVQPYFTYIHRDTTDPTLSSNGAALNGSSESVKLLGAVIPVSERGNLRMTVGRYSSGTDESDATSYGVAYTYDVSRSVMLMAAVTRLTQNGKSRWPVFQSPIPNAGNSVNGVILGITSRF
ncbi:porin [Comamonas testosteroni]|uniref:porin n=1 Tax=Comamonas testosteroni TaxID=285 RepID=UPI0015F8535E|nr:porin [Comamonas testosteroni]